MKISYKRIFSLLLIIAVILGLYAEFQLLKTVHLMKKESHETNINYIFEDPANDLENNCSDWNFPNKIQINENPRIPLDPNRFLYPGVIWGPYNQILGLQNSIYLTIRLNRTLAIPSFHAQWNHPGKLNPYEFIDVKRLCSFVSCISIEKLREKCDGSFDVAFEGKISALEYLRMYERDTGMNVIHPKRILKIPHARKLRTTSSHIQADIPALPHMVYIGKYGETMPMDASVLQTAYDTTAPCAIHMAVFDPLNAYPRDDIARPLNAKPYSASKIFDDVLYSAVMDAVMHPPCIVEAARSYIKEVLNNRPYIGLHWRYDAEDWIGRLCGGFITRRIEHRCNLIKRIKPVNVAKAIKTSFETKTSTSNHSYKSVMVYIATPTTIESFKDSIYLELEKIDDKFVRPSRSVDDYVKKRYQSCWKTDQWKNIHSILSLIEMEIMMHSYVFFYSPESTWSDKIRPHRVEVDENGRMVRKFERDILEQAAAEIS